MLKPVPLFPGRGCARRSADILRRSDFSDVEEVPEEFTDNQLRDAHNDIVRRLRPGRVVASALAALAALPLLGGLVVETHAKGSWPNTSNVVTSVSWEGGPGTDTNSVMGVVDSSFAGGTNAVNAAVAAVGSMSNSWSRAGSDATNYTDAATSAIASDVSRLSTSKADRVQGATSGNFAALDADGNLEDSGWKIDSEGNVENTFGSYGLRFPSMGIFVPSSSCQFFWIDNPQGIFVGNSGRVSVGGWNNISSRQGSGEDVEFLGEVLSGKADKVSGATTGNLASLTAEGNLADSGIPSGVIVKDEDGGDYGFRFHGGAECVRSTNAGALFEIKYGGDLMLHPWEATRFIDGQGFENGRLAFTDDIPEVVAPSTDAGASGKAADAKATGDALTNKLDRLPVRGEYDSPLLTLSGTDGSLFNSAISVTPDGTDRYIVLENYVGSERIRYSLMYLNSIAFSDNADVVLDFSRGGSLPHFYNGGGFYSVGDHDPNSENIVRYFMPWIPANIVEMYSGEQFALRSDISPADPTFSNAVLAVGLNIDTNSVAVLNEIAETFGDFPITGTATTVGGLLAALAAAVAWLRKHKVDKLTVTGMAAEVTVESGTAKLDDFFTESNTLLNARITYERNATGLKDRAFNALTFDGTEYNLSTALAAVAPTAANQPRDLLIVATATAATTISFTAGTIKGDKPTIDGAGTWLITLTEYASGVWYCRQIKMEDAA